LYPVYDYANGAEYNDICSVMLRLKIQCRVAMGSIIADPQGSFSYGCNANCEFL